MLQLKIRGKVFLWDKANVEEIREDLSKFAAEYTENFADKSIDEKWTVISKASNRWRKTFPRN